MYIYVCIYIYPYLYKQNFFNNEKSFSRIPKRQNDNAEKLPGKTTFQMNLQMYCILYTFQKGIFYTISFIPAKIKF